MQVLTRNRLSLLQKNQLLLFPDACSLDIIRRDVSLGKYVSLARFPPASKKRVCVIAFSTRFVVVVVAVRVGIRNVTLGPYGGSGSRVLVVPPGRLFARRGGRRLVFGD